MSAEAGEYRLVVVVVVVVVVFLSCFHLLMLRGVNLKCN